ncbi:transcription elongation factor Elf1 like-domain-containing protein [Xylaria intraflava]|nr:transcription elongation factor Elf1 like-domain-containing protein [Xylaria intraflava]
MAATDVRKNDDTIPVQSKYQPKASYCLSGIKQCLPATSSDAQTNASASIPSILQTGACLSTFPAACSSPAHARHQFSLPANVKCENPPNLRQRHILRYARPQDKFFIKGQKKHSSLIPLCLAPPNRLCAVSSQRATQADFITMGKRKKSSRKPQGPKKREGLAKEFTCLFCNHEKSVHVKLDKKAGVGHLSCAVCGQKFQCGIHTLMEAIDVYSEWVDAADAVAKEAAGNKSASSASFARPGARPPRADRELEDEDDQRYQGEGIVDDDDEY